MSVNFEAKIFAGWAVSGKDFKEATARALCNYPEYQTEIENFLEDHSHYVNHYSYYPDEDVVIIGDDIAYAEAGECSNISKFQPFEVFAKETDFMKRMCIAECLFPEFFKPDAEKPGYHLACVIS